MRTMTATWLAVLFRHPWTPLPLAAVLVALALVDAAVFSLRDAEKRPLTRTRFDSRIRRAAKAHMPAGWDWRLLKAMIRQESNFDVGARSRVGARGLTQIMPATAADLGIDPADLNDPDASIDAGARYLRWLWDRWEGIDDMPPDWQRTRFAIASYNAGLGRIRAAAERAGRTARWHAVKPYAPRETQTHIDRIFELYYPLCKRLHSGRATGVHPSHSLFRRSR